MTNRVADPSLTKRKRISEN